MRPRRRFYTLRFRARASSWAPDHRAALGGADSILKKNLTRKWFHQCGRSVIVRRFSGV